MNEINIYIEHENPWLNEGHTYVRGEAFHKGSHLTSDDILKKVLNLESKDDFKDLLTKFNGFFCVITKINNEIIFAGDHVRSSPIFYSLSENNLYISDNPTWIDKQANTRGYDPIVATEFLFLLYASGKDTISRNVYQLQAGEMVCCNLSRSDKVMKRTQYYEFAPKSCSSSLSLDEIDETLVQVFQRLITVADGRPILLPLSSGLDSRLIVLMLSRLGYSEVITYTYGSNEVYEAKSIAEDLNYEHVHIEVSGEDYRDVYENGMLDEIIDKIGFIHNIPQISTILQYMKIKEKKPELTDPVVVWGDAVHESARWLGSGITKPDKLTLSNKSYFHECWHQHYKRWAAQRNAKEIKDMLKQRHVNSISTELNYRSRLTMDEAYRHNQSWYWKERTPKYLLPSQEGDFVNFTTNWYPEWDKEYVELQSKITLADRGGRKLITKYIQQLDHKIRNIDKTISEDHLKDQKSTMKTLIKKGIIMSPKTISDPIVESVRALRSRKRSNYSNDPRYRMVNEEEFSNFDLYYRHPKSFWFILLYRDGYFTLNEKTELERAIN